MGQRWLTLWQLHNAHTQARQQVSWETFTQRITGQPGQNGEALEEKSSGSSM